ncbi:MAG: acyltransferase [Negativicutes bacterium]|nr:acyltransferase [Negativicutes bacterium]
MSIQTNQINFIALLRGIAALLVMWDHLVGIWLKNNGMRWEVYDFVSAYITRPLGIIQDFGWFGVVLFFLISGYIITYIMQRETRVVFLIKRLFRIYPPLIVSIFLILVFTEHSYTLRDIVYSSALINYFMIPQNPVNGVAWTLVIEMMFYISCVIGFSFIKKKPVLFVLGLLAISWLFTTYCRDFGDRFFLFVASYSFIPYLVMGQLLYFFSNKMISGRTFFLLTLFDYFTIMNGVLTIHTTFYAPNSYGVSFLYAYFIFVLCMLYNEKIQMNAVVQFYSNISYSLYLNHGVLGGLLLNTLVLTMNLPYAIALLITISGVSLISYLSYQCVELPINQGVRNWLYRRETKC